VKPLSRQNREELWDRFNQFRDRAREAQDAYWTRRNEVLNSNRAEIDHALQHLENAHNLDWISDFMGYRKELDGFWDEVADVTELFKTLKPLRRGDREELWNWFSNVKSKAKQAEDRYYEAKRERHEEWRQKTEAALER